MALATVDEFIDHLRMDRRDLRTDAFEIWNSDAAAATASVQVTKSALALVKTGGTNPATDTLAFASYATLDLLLAAVEALGGASNRGWLTYKLCNGSSAPNLYFMDAASVKGFVERSVVEIVETTRLTGILDAAAGLISRFCRRTFEETTYTGEYYSGTGATKLLLRNYPVKELASIYKVTGRTGLVESTELVDADGYEVDYDAGIIWRDLGWEAGKRNYKVTHKSGYSTIPPELKNVSLDVAAILYYSTGRDPLILVERVGPYSRQMLREALPPVIEMRLTMFRRLEDPID